jgi:hypothetical protein
MQCETGRDATPAAASEGLELPPRQASKACLGKLLPGESGRIARQNVRCGGEPVKLPKTASTNGTTEAVTGPADSRWAVVERIAASRQFEHSPKLREFLFYVCRRNLEDPAARISEQEIGCNVFGRPPHFDAGADTIVRVHASRLRRSLEQYFNTDGRGEPVVLSIPKGGYNPVWETRSAPAEAAVPASPYPRSLVASLAALSGVLVLVCAVLAVQNRNQRGSRAVQAPPPTAVHRFWQQVWGNGRPTYIVLSDANLSLWSDMTGRSLTLAEYLGQAWSGPHAGGCCDAAARLVMLRQYTSFAEALIANRLARLAPAEAEVLFAREASLRQLQLGNVILIGSRRSNPWVENFSKSLKFCSRCEAAGRKPGVENLSPQPGEPPRYESGPGQGYAHVAFVPNVNGSSNAVILAGTEMQSSEAAGIFLTTERNLSELQRLLHVGAGDPFPYFELVLQARAVGATGSPARVVAYWVEERAGQK